MITTLYSNGLMTAMNWSGACGKIAFCKLRSCNILQGKLIAEVIYDFCFKKFDIANSSVVLINCHCSMFTVQHSGPDVVDFLCNF